MFARLGTSNRTFILKKPFDREEVLQIAHTLTAGRQPGHGDSNRGHKEADLRTRGSAAEAIKKRLSEEMAGLKPVRPDRAGG